MAPSVEGILRSPAPAATRGSPSARTTTMAAWQHPFVDLFKLVSLHDGTWSGVRREGNSSSVMDKVIGRRVLRVTGSVAASNNVTIPHPNPADKAAPTSLGLTGCYAYVQLRAMAPKLFTLHLEVLSLDGSTTRFTFSNMFRKGRRKGNVVQVPLNGVGAKWTVLSVDLRALVEKYAPPNCPSPAAQYWCIKSVQLCSNCSVRGVYTSDNVYSSTGTTAMPRALALPLLGGKEFETLYDWVWRPAPPSASAAKPPAPGVPAVRSGSRLVPPPSPSMAGRAARSLAMATAPPLAPPPGSPRGRRHYSPAIKMANSGDASLARAAAVLRRRSRGSTPTPARSATKVTGVAKSNEVRALERRRVPFAQRRGDEANLNGVSIKESIRGESGHNSESAEDELEAHLLREREAVISEARSIIARAGMALPDSVMMMPAGSKGGRSTGPLPMTTRPAGLPPQMSRERQAQAERAVVGHALRPDPILELKTLIGFSGGGSQALKWSADGKWIVFPSASNIVVMRPPGVSAEEPKSEQRILFGHTSTVCALAFNRDGSLLCSGQEGKCPVLRLWDFDSGRCIAIIAAHSHGLCSVDFSEDDSMLCAVGRDAHNRVQIMVWDISRVGAGGKFAVVARQTSEFDIRRIKFSPYDPTHLVSCGRENIRFWRIRNSHLPGCPVILNEYARQTTFSDLAFESGYGPRPLSGGAQKHVFVSTELGTVVQINYDSRKLECVYRLHDGPINCLAVNEGFCVTGSGDCFLRVWPLDFSDYFLEAKHEGAIASVDVSPDGLKIIIGTQNGTVGLLDVTSHSHSTIQRAHTGEINMAAMDPYRSEFATVSQDGSIRVWSLETCEQLYEFNAPGDVCNCVAYFPSADEHTLACGFESGSVRVFDVAETAMKHEYQQHRGPVVQVAFSPDTTKLFSGGVDGHICVYDIPRGYQPVRMVASDYPSDHVGLEISPDGTFLATIGPDGTCIVLFDVATMAPVCKIQRPRPLSTISRWGAGAAAASERSSGGFGVQASFTLVRWAPSSRELVCTTEDHRVARYRLKRARGSGENKTSSNPAGWCAVLVREMHSAHREGIRGLAISPNNGYILTAGDDRLLKVWDYAMRGHPPTFQTFIGHSDVINDVHFSIDGKHAISVGAGASVLVWRFLGETDEISRIAEASSALYMEDDDGEDDEEVQAQDVDRIFNEDDIDDNYESTPSLPWKHFASKPIEVTTSSSSERRRGHSNLQSHCSGSGTESRVGGVGVASGASTSAAPSMRVRSVIGFNARANPCVVWHPTSGLFAFASGRTLVIEDLATRAQRRVLSHTTSISGITLSPDGRRIATMAEPDANGSSVCIHDVVSKPHVDRMLAKVHKHGVQAAAFSTDGAVLVTAGTSQDGTLAVWNSATGAPMFKTGLAGPVHAIAFISSNSFVTSGTGGFSRWRFSTSKSLEREDKALSHFVPSQSFRDCASIKLSAMAIAPGWVARAHGAAKHGVVALGDDTGRMLVCALGEGGAPVKLLAWWQCIDGTVSQISWSDRSLIVASVTGTVASWSVGSSYPTPEDPSSYEPEKVFQGFTGPIVAMQWDSTGSEGVIGASDGNLYYAKMKGSDDVTPLARGHTGPITDVCFSDDGELFLTAGSSDTTLRIWSASSLEQGGSFISSTESIALCARFSPSKGSVASSNRICAAGYSDGKLRLFDVTGLQAINRVVPQPSHPAAITALTYVLGGGAIVAGSADGAVHIVFLGSNGATGLPDFAACMQLLDGEHEHFGASITSVETSPHDDSVFLVADKRNRLTVWRIEPENLKCVQLAGYIASGSEPTEVAATRCLARFAPDNPAVVVFVASGRKRLTFYNFELRVVERALDVESSVSAIAVSKSRNGETSVLLGHGDQVVRVNCDGTAREIISSGHSDIVRNISLSPTGMVLTTSGSELIAWSQV